MDHEDRLIPAGRSGGLPVLLPHSRKTADKERGSYPGFVVVQLHKLAQNEHVDQRVARINEFFFDHGADRVLVTGFRGFGRSIYSDRIKEPNQPTDRPLPAAPFR